MRWGPIVVLGVATLGAGVGCSSAVDDVLGRERVQAPPRLLVSSLVEFVDDSDPRVRALDPPDTLGIMSMPDGNTQHLLIAPTTCGDPPDVRVEANGDRLEVMIFEAEDGGPCREGAVVYIELVLNREFRRITFGSG